MYQDWSTNSLIYVTLTWILCRTQELNFDKVAQEIQVIYDEFCVTTDGDKPTAASQAGRLKVKKFSK